MCACVHGMWVYIRIFIQVVCIWDSVMTAEIESPAESTVKIYKGYSIP